MSVLGSAAGWIGALILGFFGVRSAGSAFADLLLALELLLSTFAWPIIITVSYAMSVRLRAWRDQ